MTQRRERKEWRGSSMTDAPPNAPPCQLNEGWSIRSWNIPEEDSGMEPLDVFCTSHCRHSAVWTRRLCGGTCLEQPGGQSLGRR